MLSPRRGRRRQRGAGGGCAVRFPGLPRATNAEGGAKYRTLSRRSRTEDGGRPSASALQGEAANHRKRRRLSAEVVSIAEKPQ